MVEVSGLAVGPYTMIAPVTARPCYYYRTVVWEWKQSGKNKQWVKVAGESMHVPFFLDDNTGRVLVDPRSADLDLHRDFEQEFCDSFFTSKEPVPGNVRSFLSRHGIVTSNKIKVEEYCIKPKNSLFLLGTLAENPGIEVTAQPVRDAEPTSSFSSFSGQRVFVLAEFAFVFNRWGRRRFQCRFAEPAPRKPIECFATGDPAVAGVHSGKPFGHDSATEGCRGPHQSRNLEPGGMGCGGSDRARVVRVGSASHDRPVCWQWSGGGSASRWFRPSRFRSASARGTDEGRE